MDLVSKSSEKTRLLFSAYKLAMFSDRCVLDISIFLMFITSTLASRLMQASLQ